jgi:hypothetical protein
MEHDLGKKKMMGAGQGRALIGSCLGASKLKMDWMI